MRLSCAVLVLFPSLVLAAEEVPDAGVAAVAPAPVAAPAPAPAPSVIDQLFEVFKPYGLFKPTVILPGSAVESFSQPNASAMTAAANPVLALAPDQPRLTFQVAQSRLGFWFNPKGKLRGHFEFDFIDFTKASPTVASLPRLRIARVDWMPLEGLTLSLGQDWDLFSPLNPHGSNLVGGLFLAGNAGFMRQQLKVLYKVGAFEFAAAAGMEGINATAKDGAFELAVTPTGALRVSAQAPFGKLVLSGIAARLTLGVPMARAAFAGAVSLGGELTVGPLNLRAEGYVGQNLANLGALTLAFGNAIDDIQEAGGWLSARVALAEMHALYGRVGLAATFNSDKVVPSYTYSSLPADGSAPSPSLAVLAGTGPGITNNFGAVLGYELRVLPQLSFLLEGFAFRTEHTLRSGPGYSDTERFGRTRLAFGGELAALVNL